MRHTLLTFVMRKINQIALIVVSTSILFAQKPCGTTEYLHHLLQQQGLSQDEYARWLSLQAKNLRHRQQSERRLEKETIKIPILFHIIHYTEETSPPPHAYNIPELQIKEQLGILNQSFSQTHPRARDIPPSFSEISAGNTHIEFHLAQRDTLDFPTNGIIRKQVPYTNNNLSKSIQEHLKEVSPPWNPSQYLNVYVVPYSLLQLTGANYVGLATLPAANIPGLRPGKLYPFENTYMHPDRWDAIIIATEVFGKGLPINLPEIEGKTLVHEMGHYLALFHNWGDGNCNADDYCADTPLQAAPTSSEAACTEVHNSCGSRDMSENYMDYSSDPCMMMFTKCQGIRMRAALYYSVDRFSLWEKEDKITAAPSLTHDAGIIQQSEHTPPPCEKPLEGSLSIGNYGTRPITSLRIAFFLDQQLIEEKSYLLNIPTHSSESPSPTGQITYGPITVNGYGVHELEARITSINKTQDMNPANDTLRAEFIYSPSQQTANGFLLTEDFESDPKWHSYPSQGEILRRLPTSSSSSQILAFELAGSPSHTRNKHYTIQSPVMDLSTFSPTEEQLLLRFRYSHQVNPHKLLNTLSIATRSGASECLSSPYKIIFSRNGSDLHTGLERRASDRPTYHSDWQEIQLPVVVDGSFMQLMIGVTNGQGGNIYLDDISIARSKRSSATEEQPLRITQAIVPLLSCGQTSHPLLLSYSNYGTEVIDFSNTWTRVYRHQDAFKSNWTSILSTLSARARIRLLAADTNDDLLLSLHIEGYDGLVHTKLDLATSASTPSPNLKLPPENSVDIKFFVSQVQALPPLQEQFLPENRFQGWKPATFLDNPDREWQYAQSAQGAHFIKAPLFDRDASHQQPFFRLFSPRIDLRNLSEASISFHYASAQRRGAMNRLRLFVFENCEAFPSALIYDKAGAALASTQREKEWLPLRSTDWKQEIIDLSDYIGQEINLLFIASTSLGPSNHIYLDNIYIHETSSPVHLPIAGRPEDVREIPWVHLFPNPTSSDQTSLLFDLEAPQSVRVSCIDLSGRILWQQQLEDIQSQLIELSLPLRGEQIYILRLETPDRSQSFRLIMR